MIHLALMVVAGCIIIAAALVALALAGVLLNLVITATEAIGAGFNEIMKGHPNLRWGLIWGLALLPLLCIVASAGFQS